MKLYECGVKGTEWTSEISADTPGKAKYRYLCGVRDAWQDVSFTRITCRRLGVLAPRKRPAEEEAEKWNSKHPIGTPVEYWTWTREGEGKHSKTRTKAHVVCDNAVVWVDGEASCISLSHVQAEDSR